MSLQVQESPERLEAQPVKQGFARIRKTPGCAGG